MGLAPAHAERASTREAFERLGELLELRVEDGLLDRGAVLPLLLVAATPRYEASAPTFEARAVQTLVRVFGADGVRLCLACQVPRTDVTATGLTYAAGPSSREELVELDARLRGPAGPSRAAAWLTETPTGLAARIMDLSSGQLRFAQLIDPQLTAHAQTSRTYARAAEYERRARGDSLTHAFFDAAIYPGQHVSLEWADQFGADNQHLAGVVLSIVDPILGLGLSYHRVLPFQDITVGAQLLLSIPTAAAQAVAGISNQLIDPLLTVAGLLRWPIGSSNFAGLLSVSTNGTVGLGISLINTTFLPVLP